LFVQCNTWLWTENHLSVCLPACLSVRESYRGHKPKNELTGSKLTRMPITTSDVIGYRTWCLFSHVWPVFQIWGRSDKNHGRYRGRYVFRTDRQTDIHSIDRHMHKDTLKWFYICAMPCIALDKQQGIKICNNRVVSIGNLWNSAATQWVNCHLANEQEKRIIDLSKRIWAPETLCQWEGRMCIS